MESSVARHSEGDDEEDGIYLFIVDNETDEQPKNTDDENSQPSMNSIEIKHKKTLHSEFVIKTENLETEDEFEPMIEEYISDETHVPSEEDDEKIINKKLRAKRAQKNSKSRRMCLLPKDKQKSFVNELRRSNPDCKDQNVLISRLCKIMKETKPPPPPDDYVIETDCGYECSNCGYTAHRVLMVTHHWQEKHGTRYLNCLACGADFRWPANLYKHERTCNAPDIKLVLKARNRVKQHKNKKDKAKKSQPSEQGLLVERKEIKKDESKKGRKRKALKENKAKSKASRGFQEKKPKHKKKKPKLEETKPKLAIRDIVENTEEVSDSDMSLEIPMFDSGTDSDYKFSGLEDSDSDFDQPLVKPKAKPKRRGIPRRSPIKETQQPAYLSELQREKPELYEDKEQLVKALAEIMAKEKPPDPPEGFALLNKDSIYECSKCQFKDKSWYAAARHWQYIHGPRCYKCYACGFCFRNPCNLYKHEKFCTSADTYIVLRARARSIVWNGRNNRPFLDETLTKLKTGNRRRNKKTGDYICRFCSREFKNTQTLDAHENLHKAQRPYQCEHCPVNYYDKASLYRHRQKKHRQGHFVCDQCKRVFNTRDHLRSHMDSHLPAKKFPCPQCGKRYAHRIDLKIHVNKLHLKIPPPCACKLCPKRYPRMTLLKQHMFKQHGVTIISRKMLQRNPDISKEQLKNAIIVDKSEFNAQPDENTSNTTENIQFHGELVKNELNDTKVIIYDELPEKPLPNDTPASQKKFECPDCDKQYVCKNDLRHHFNRVHLNKPQPFPCSLCDKRYCNMKMLKTHMLAKHGMELIPRTKVRKTLSKLSEEQLKNITVVKKPKPDSDQNVIEKVSIETEIRTEDNFEGNDEINHDENQGNYEIHHHENPEASQEAYIDTSSQNVEVEEEVEIDTSHNYEGSEYEEPENIEEEYEEDYLEEEEEEGDDQEPPEDLLEIVKKHGDKTEEKKPMLVIKDGQAVFMDGDNVGYFKKSSRNFKIKSDTQTKGDFKYQDDSEPKIAVEYQENVITETNQALLQYYDKFCNRATDLKPIKKESPKKEVKIHSIQEAKKKPKIKITSIQEVTQEVVGKRRHVRKKRYPSSEWSEW